MNISIDFDDTYTRDPLMWNKFILDARAHGHTVYCVTARGESFPEEVEEVLATIGRLVGQDNCIFTDGKQKRQVCLNKNINIHVWIDDMPEAIPDRTKSLFGYYS